MIQFHLTRSALVFVVSCIAFLACLSQQPLARSDDATPEEIGLKIALEAREQAEGFGNFTARQTMVLRNKQGQESRRQLRVRVLEVAGDGDKSMFVFDEPRDVKGTALLIHSHRGSADGQWLYLPALKRVKRISSSNRSGSFMGSEFAYEDMSAQEVEKFSYRYVRDEPCGELTCTVSERVPVGKKSGYRRQLVWRDKDELRVWKVEYYDRKVKVSRLRGRFISAVYVGLGCHTPSVVGEQDFLPLNVMAIEHIRVLAIDRAFFLLWGGTDGGVSKRAHVVGNL